MRTLLRAGVLIWMATGLFQTGTRVQTWTSERALWQAALTVSPASPRPWLNLGREYHLTGRRDLAQWYYAQGERASLDRHPLERIAVARAVARNRELAR